jgi:hypothetical protein
MAILSAWQIGENRTGNAFLNIVNRCDFDCPPACKTAVATAIAAVGAREIAPGFAAFVGQNWDAGVPLRQSSRFVVMIDGLEGKATLTSTLTFHPKESSQGHVFTEFLSSRRHDGRLEGENTPGWRRSCWFLLVQLWS